MVFIAIPILLFLICFKVKFAKSNEYFEDNMSREKTTSINGIFVVLVFFSHLRRYFNWNYFDYIYYNIQLFSSQLIVVSFLFFSGYGMMESLNRKGTDYVKTIASKRFPKLFIDFSIAISLFTIVNVVLGNELTIPNLLLSYTAWNSIGNSNWYILAIFSFYIIFIIAFMITKNKPLKYGLILTTILSVGFVICLSFFKQFYYYNTFLCLPFGMYFSLIKNRLLTFIRQKPFNYYFTLIASIILCCFMFHYLQENPYIFNIISILFAFIIYLLTLKISIHNHLLNWLGGYVFWIYILQRIPMMIFNHIGIQYVNSYLFITLSCITTLILAYLFKKLSNKLEQIIWKTEKV